MEAMVSRVQVDSITSEEVSDDSVDVPSLASKTSHSAVTPERVSEIFGCGLETAKNTICVTTQHGVSSAIHLLRCCYQTDLLSLKYCRLNKHMFMDMMKFKTKSLQQNTYAQVYTTKDWASVYPMCSSVSHCVGNAMCYWVMVLYVRLSQEQL